MCHASSVWPLACRIHCYLDSRNLSFSSSLPLSLSLSLSFSSSLFLPLPRIEHKHGWMHSPGVELTFTWTGLKAWWTAHIQRQTAHSAVHLQRCLHSDERYDPNESCIPGENHRSLPSNGSCNALRISPPQTRAAMHAIMTGAAPQTSVAIWIIYAGAALQMRAMIHPRVTRAAFQARVTTHPRYESCNACKSCEFLHCSSCLQ